MRDFVQSYLRLPFTAAEIRRAIGIIRTNSVKLEGGRGRGEGAAIFPTYSYANHSCVCNTFTRKTGTRLELVAQVAQSNIPVEVSTKLRESFHYICNYKRDNTCVRPVRDFVCLFVPPPQLQIRGKKDWEF